MDVQAGGHGPTLKAANGSCIQTFWKINVLLCSSGHRFTWDFVTEKVSTPLLGTGFLCANGLLVDVKNRRFVNTDFQFAPVFSQRFRHDKVVQGTLCI
ncbi:hypothetical protein AAFF_G00392130 [Aldrovandia affinis]|uniref:Uncharacterized protein n=1 Tax=Aldrovandia affinis TaxID=143900 RepID=A0AAD7WLW4_9TELE|nr:hypothetical protein AAFF_G00392130 [Aldrovandia affinis]